MTETANILQVDTLRCDSLSLVEWKSQNAYDYGHELITPDFNVMQWIMERINKYFDGFVDTSGTDQYVKVAWVIAGLVVLAAVGYLLWRNGSKLFGSVGKSRAIYPDEDTIYGIDFDAAIRRALESENYHEAVRMVYLQTLRYLSDNDYINWQIFKTPTQYIMEMKSDTFRTFTLHFIRVRYGNYDADVTLYETMQDMQDTLRQQNPPKDDRSKGGDE